MSDDRRAGPVEVLRHVALSLERLIAHEAASGVVRGAADGLRKEMPEIDGQVRGIVQDALTVLGRLVHEAAVQQPVDPAAAAQNMAASAMQGMLDVLESEWQDGGMPLHSFIERLNLLLDEVIAFAHSRTDEIRTPRERAQAITETIVDAALGRLHVALPVLTEDLRGLAPLGGEVSASVGQGLVTGLRSRLQQEEDALGALLHHAGREWARGLASGAREELVAMPELSSQALGDKLEGLAERTASAAVRGAGGALTEQARTWREAQQNDPRAVRRLSRDVTAGVLDALAERLRRPLLAVAGAGGLMTLAVLATRWRRA